MDYETLSEIGAAYAGKCHMAALPNDEGVGFFGFAPGTNRIIAGTIAWSAEWFAAGRPTVELDTHELERLCSVEPPNDDVHSAHRHFLIVLPLERGLSLVSTTNGLETVSAVSVTWYPDRWTFVAYARTVEYSHTWSPTDALRRGESVGPITWLTPAERERWRMRAHDYETRRRLGRLILNVAAESMNKEVVK